MPRCDRDLPFHIPVRSVQLGHFVSAPAQRTVARGRATRAQLLECAPDRAVAAVEWLSTDTHTLISGGASDGLLKVWDLRATACQGAVLGDETPYARPTATRTLPMPLYTVRVRPGTSVASMHLHAPTGRLAVAAPRHGRPDAGTVAVLNAAHLGNTHRNHGIERQVHCPLWSHYARVRFDASGEYLAFGSGCDLCVIDWTSIPPRWDAPLEANADVVDAALPQNGITSVRRSAEVTAVDWSRVHPCRVAAVADNEHVHITEWGLRGEEGEVEGHRAARHRLDGKPIRLWYHPGKRQRRARGETGGIPCECCADERVAMEKVPQRASLCARCAAATSTGISSLRTSAVLGSAFSTVVPGGRFPNPGRPAVACATPPQRFRVPDAITRHFTARSPLPADLIMDERTFIMVKPDGVQRRLVAEIISRFERRGYQLIGIKMLQASAQRIDTHYAELTEKPFYPGLKRYMLSGPVVAMAWKGKAAAATGRALVGATNPRQSAPGTIRGDYCIDVGRNVVHASDSVESAEREIKIWFQADELVGYADPLSDWIYEDA
eukprot:ctg_588.g265